jgi:hypothetical protein
LGRAGNPERKGQAGATQLLVNPWGSTSGWHGVNMAGVSGLESMRLNVAGLSSMDQGLQAGLTQTTWLDGADISILSGGLAFHLDEEGYNSIGITAMSFDFGDITETTEQNPDGIGEFNFNTFNLGIGYSHKFSDQINAGILARYFSEGLDNVSATGIAFDVGVQYSTGQRNRTRFGVSLRNVGPTARFSGDGLEVDAAISGRDFDESVNLPSNEFELPSQLNIGLEYDLITPKRVKVEEDTTDAVLESIEDSVIESPFQVTLAGSFASNAFDKDQFRFGVEFGFREIIAVRGGFLYSEGVFNDELANEERTSIYTGPSGGLSVNIPFSEETNKALEVHYSFRASDPYSGVHTVGATLKL